MGPADRVSELVPDVRVLRSLVSAIEPVARASESVPAAELIGITVECVGPALGNHVDDRAGITAVFGVEVIGNDTEFLGGFRIRAQYPTDATRH